MRVGDDIGFESAGQPLVVPVGGQRILVSERAEIADRPHAARTAADGLRSQSIGEINFEHIRKYVDEIVTVTEDEIRRAMEDVFGAYREPVFF